MTVERTVLAGGITVVSERVPHFRSVTVGMWVPAGSRHEAPGDNGISHFIEHMLFKGTSRRRPVDISREIESVGGQLNAFTDHEYVFFFARALARDFSRIVDLLSDIYLDSLFDAEELGREKGVVLQEILMVDDSPEDYLNDYFQAHYFPGHPLGLPVQGTTGTVEAFDRDRVRSYFLDRFRRRGLVISVVSDLPHEAVLDAFAKSLSGLSLSPHEAPAAPSPAMGGVWLKERPLEQFHLCLGAPAVSLRSDLRFAAHVLSTLLGGSMSSLLFQEVREQRGLVYSIYSALSSYSDSGVLRICAGTTADKAAEVLDVVADVLARVREGRFAEEDVRLARELIKGNVLLSLESGEYRMTRLAMNEMFLGHAESPEEIVRRVDAVTPEQVRELAATICGAGRFSLAAVGDLPPETLQAP